MPTKEILYAVGRADYLKVHQSKPNPFREGESLYSVTLAVPKEFIVSLRKQGVTQKPVQRTDELGNKVNKETDDGKLLFEFRRRAIPDANGVVAPLAIADETGQPFNTDKRGLIGYGSILRVAYTLNPWSNPKTGDSGLSVIMEGVQIVDLLSFKPEPQSKKPLPTVDIDWSKTTGGM